MADLARAAERLGYAHLWVSDHVLLPRASHGAPAVTSSIRGGFAHYDVESDGDRLVEAVATLR